MPNYTKSEVEQLLSFIQSEEVSNNLAVLEAVHDQNIQAEWAEDSREPEPC